MADFTKRFTPRLLNVAMIALSVWAIAPSAEAKEGEAAPVVGAAGNAAFEKVKQKLKANPKTAAGAENAKMPLAIQRVYERYEKNLAIQKEKIAVQAKIPGVVRVAAGPAEIAEQERLAFRDAIRILASTHVTPGYRSEVEARVKAGLLPSKVSAVPRVGSAATTVVNSPKFDWRTSGGVPSLVRNQDTCGSCWAFAAVGVTESSMMIQKVASPAQPDLSEQFLVNDGSAGNCGGGFYIDAWQLIMSVTGTADETTVPYANANGSGNPASFTPYKIAAYGLVDTVGGKNTPTVEMLKKELLERGPLAVCVEADEAFSVWGGGVFHGFKSNDLISQVNHAVILVGWDETNPNEKHWIVRNSWGSEWCEDGYIRIAYETNNIGLAAGWAQFAINGSGGGGVLPPPTSLLNEKDRTSLEIWKQLALLQSKHSDLKVYQNLRPEFLRSAQSVQAATDAKDLEILKDPAKIAAEWDDVLKKLTP